MTDPTARRLAARIGRRSLLAGALIAIGGCGSADRRGAAGNAPGWTDIARSSVRVTGDLAAAEMASVADAAERACSTVRTLWGPGSLWAAGGRAQVVAVATHDQFVRLGGGSSEQVAATTRPDRVVLISLPALKTLTPAGVQAVLAHELTHSRLGLPADSPRWLLEGSAEFSAWRGSGLTLPAYAPSLLARVRTGQAPTGPPADSEFAATGGSFRAAYQDALAWCAFLQSRGGLPRLVTEIEASIAAHGGAAARMRTAYGSDASLARPFDAWLQKVTRVAAVPTPAASAAH
ncbi:M48 family metalloprotease [Calidifontibacter terrae]